jgi:ATP-dependent DNA helicase RecQ
MSSVTDTPTDRAAAALGTVLDAVAPAGSAPRDDQVKAVAELLSPGARVLVVQATGWGKSAVYWAATIACRAAGAGPTLVVSPLLALMRDQVAAAERAGLVAATVNSANVDDWDEVLAALDADRLDVLLVSPERLASPAFARRLDALVGRCGLLVVDEAHCISDWGSDFRPDYQRLSRVLVRLGPRTPVLATTATANERVTADVARQLGDDTVTLRGTLARPSLRLEVVPGLDALGRYAWVDQALGELPGSGIVYCLTVAEAERLGGFLAERGHEVATYTGALDPTVRTAVEDRLRDNELKAVVATSALGMGYDKPDLAFCIHTGSPPSPVAYYQQVGRAGRALDDAVAVLLPAESDERLWEWFATASLPDPDHVRRLLGVLDHGEARSIVQLEAETGVRRGKLESLLKLLAVDDVVQRVDGGWARGPGAWHEDTAHWDELRRVRAAEASLMRDYARGRGCLMEYLQRALDDPDPGPCGRCSVCVGGPSVVTGGVDPAAVEAARAYVRGQDVVMEPRKRWPSRVSRTGAIAGPAEGRALAHADDPGWADALRAPGDRYPDEVVDGVVAVLGRWRRAWSARPVAVVPLPGTGADARVAGLCAEIGRIGKLPVLDLLERTGSPVPDDVASGARVAALEGALRLADGAADAIAALDGPVLLVSATTRTGWTQTVAAALLREAGVDCVLPLAVHRLP